MNDRGKDASNGDRSRMWELVELLEEELSKPEPDWGQVRAASRELCERVECAG